METRVVRVGYGGYVNRTGGELIFATYLAPSIRPVYEAVARTVGSRLGRPARLVVGESWDQLRNGEFDLAFICGLPYVRLALESPRPVVPVAVPVLEGERYQGRPIYFSDVIVRTEDSAARLVDLKGRAWAYNEPDSHSGYLVTLHRLLEMGETGAFFGRSVMTGFHHRSIRAVISGDVDASAIDSQVLALELREHPDLRARVRVIDTLGPSTIQPLVAARHVPKDVGEVILDAVTSMDGDALTAGMVRRFVPIEDRHYDDIRSMLAAVEACGLTL